MPEPVPQPDSSWMLAPVRARLAALARQERLHRRQPTRSSRTARWHTCLASANHAAHPDGTGCVPCLAVDD